MKLFCIKHLPTGQFFPSLSHGASHFEFNERKDHRKLPRLFRREFDARRYVTEYCKGIKRESIRNSGIAYDPVPGRNIKHFIVLPVTLTFGDHQ